MGQAAVEYNCATFDCEGAAKEFIEEVLNARELQKLDTLCSDKVIFRGLLSVGQDVSAFRSVLQEIFAAFPDATFYVETIIAQKNHAFVSTLFRGTFQWNFRGMRATHRRVCVPMNFLFRFANDRIVEIAVLHDSHVFHEQVGANLPHEQVWQPGSKKLRNGEHD